MARRLPFCLDAHWSCAGVAFFDLPHNGHRARDAVLALDFRTQRRSLAYGGVCHRVLKRIGQPFV